MKGKELAEALSGEEEIKVTFTRSKNGRKRTVPVWFVVNGTKLELLPMYGLGTKWFRDVEKSGAIEIRAGQEKLRAVPVVVRDKAVVDQVKGRFSLKYGEADVKRYYPTSEVALEVPL